VPFFLPFAGCPGRCVFCDQKSQTGSPERDLEQALVELDNRLSCRQGPFALGFFGGTFTGLPVRWQQWFLERAGRYRRPDGLVHLRVSTRPDRVDPDTLSRLRELGVSMVELGVQTFDAVVLEKCGRGYDGATAVTACRMVREAGVELGIQLLPGLPGHGPALWREDVRMALDLTPEAARIYPCLVLAGTDLAACYAAGDYTPWTLDMAVTEAAWALVRFWEKGVRVIRLGLAAEAGMLGRLVAGPWHPAFGNMVRARALRYYLQEQIGPGRAARLMLPRRLAGELWGHARSEASALAELGIVKDRVEFWSESDIVVELEE